MKTAKIRISKHKIVMADLVVPRAAKPNFAGRFSLKAKHRPYQKGAVDFLLEERGL